MSDFIRYAIYYLPEGALARFGAEWLGWDVDAGKAVAQPDLAPLCDALPAITRTPRKYGFHATLKAPFRLVENASVDALHDAVAELAAETPAPSVDRLSVQAIGPFLALCPEGDTTALDALAAACVTELDQFREDPTEAELSRRRAGGLSPRQDQLLQSWGYPYVLEEFRFHITLTGRIEAATAAQVRAALHTACPPLGEPHVFGGIALVGERADGMFQTIQRYALTG